MKFIQPLSGNFTCDVSLSNQFNLTRSYSVTFATDCTEQNLLVLQQEENAKKNGSYKFKAPVPSIGSIDRSGKVQIDWSI